MKLNTGNVLSFWTRVPFTAIGVLAFLPYLFALNYPWSNVPLPIPASAKWFVDHILSVPRDIWDWLVYLAYPQNENVWYRNYLNAGLATVLMHSRAILVESARRKTKLRHELIYFPFSFLLWPVFIFLMIREYFVFRVQAGERGEQFDSVPYFVFIEAPTYAIGVTLICTFVGALFPSLV